MASWIIHLRVCEKLFSTLTGCPETEFTVGNIAPDTGRMNADRLTYTPEKSVTHFTSTGSNFDISPEKFYKEYLTAQSDPKKRAFYLGYYAHLYTDVLWMKFAARPVRLKYHKQFEADKLFIYELKRDWYDLDKLYLKENPEFHTWAVFTAITDFPNIYLPFHDENALNDTIGRIKSFYAVPYDRKPDDKYVYFTKEEADDFVSRAADIINSDKSYIESKNILCLVG